MELITPQAFKCIVETVCLCPIWTCSCICYCRVASLPRACTEGCTGYIALGISIGAWHPRCPVSASKPGAKQGDGL